MIASPSQRRFEEQVTSQSIRPISLRLCAPALRAGRPCFPYDTDSNIQKSFLLKCREIEGRAGQYISVGDDSTHFFQWNACAIGTHVAFPFPLLGFQ